MAPKKTNPRKERFLSNLPTQDFVSEISDVKGKLSFSFKYFDASQEAGQDFVDWNDKQKQELLEKLRDYSRESKVFWLNQRVGSGGLKVLEIYGGFPKNSDFEYPKHVPEKVRWARFRLVISKPFVQTTVLVTLQVNQKSLLRLFCINS